MTSSVSMVLKRWTLEILISACVDRLLYHSTPINCYQNTEMVINSLLICKCKFIFLQERNGSETPPSGRETPRSGRETPRSGRETPHSGSEMPTATSDWIVLRCKQLETVRQRLHFAAIKLQDQLNGIIAARLVTDGSSFQSNSLTRRTLLRAKWSDSCWNICSTMYCFRLEKKLCNRQTVTSFVLLGEMASTSRPTMI